MNYLKQINEFHQRRKLYPLSGMAIALYYILLERFNQVRFPEAMPISTIFLASELSVSSTTIRNCREELVRSGYISCSCRGKTCTYVIIEMNSEYSIENIENEPAVSQRTTASEEVYIEKKEYV